jgi:hypothetical protein
MMRTVAVFFAAILSCNAATAEEGVPAQLTREDIIIVQKKLDALEFRAEITGVMDDQTKKAIRELHVDNHQKGVDYLTSEELARLKNTDISTMVYAAVAASTDEATATTWNKPSRKDAETEVMAQCRSRSAKPRKCIVQSRSSASGEGWIAAVYCKRSNARVIHEATRLVASYDKADAIEGVYEDALAAGYSKNNCRLTAVIESRGRHKK